MAKRTLMFAAALVAVAIGVVAGGPLAGAAGSGGGPGLSKAGRELVALATANGDSSVTLLLGAKDGASAALESSLTSLGATVGYEDADLGYLRVEVAPAKAQEAASLGTVATADVDTVDPLEVPQPEAGGDVQAQPDATTPALNPYMPTRDVGAPQFIQSHPTYDGRGVKIGIVDSGVDLDRPELQTAKDLDGHTVPKIYDWVTTTIPNLQDGANGDPTWLPMSPVTAAGSTFTVGTTTYTAPKKNGAFMFGVFDEADPRLGGELGNDVNRDGDRTDKFPVLWQKGNGTVWVDVNQNNNFADDSAMTDYKNARQVGHFGTDNPATTNVVETVPFVVQTDKKDDMVNIGIVAAGHGTHVAGIAAGKDFFGGAFDGTAPEAQLAVARVCLFNTGAGCPSSAQTEAFIYLVKKADVDIVQMSIGGLPALNDGNTTRDLMIDRLIDKYNTQFFFSIGNNGPGTNTAGDPGIATDVIASGAYQSADTWIANYGTPSPMPKADTLWTFSSRGPREDGGLKPQIVSPGSALSTWPAWNLSAGSVRPYAVPPGYDMIQGTSMSSPMTAGVGALLISGAKQIGMQWIPADIRQALMSTARYLPGYGAYEQGAGLIDVAAAWEQFRQSPKSVSEGISSTAPVNTALSDFLAVPDQGPGIYEREGWKAGDTGTRTIVFSQKGLPPTRYDVSWLGNDGTFSGASTIEIPRNKPAGYLVTIHPTTTGVHSAILRLDDPDHPGIEYMVLNTIVAAQDFTVANNFVITDNGTVDRADKQSFFFRVAPNTPTLKIDESVTNGRTKLDITDPFGVPVTFPAPCGCTADFATGPATRSTTINNPIAGVWEIAVEASRTAVPLQSTATFSVASLGADISPTSWTIDPATIGTTYNQTFTFGNRFGAFTGGAAGTALGSTFAKPAAPADAGGAQQVYDIDVPSGATRLDVRIGNPSDPSADLDLFLFDCHTGTCVLSRQSAGGTAVEAVSVNNPAAGLWRAVVDLFAIPSGHTTYDYTDVFQAPTLGSVSITDPQVVRPNGSVWTANASVTPLASPGAGRFLQGFVQVRSGTSILGQAEVALKNVS